MKKNLFLAVLTIALLSFPDVSAQSFLKKLGDAVDKISQLEEKSNKPANVTTAESLSPVSIGIVSTRLIGDKLLVSGKMISSEEVRIDFRSVTAITPDGEIYKAGFYWWGGNPISISSFGTTLISDINYNFDWGFDIKSKAINSITSMTVEIYNYNLKKMVKIPLKNIAIPSPADENLGDPGTFEIFKNIYLRWTKATEAADGFRLDFVVENKGTNEQEIQFRPYNKATIIDKDGNSYQAELTLKDQVAFPVDVPVAGSIISDKPLKLNKISLLEFASRNYTYKIRKIVVPQDSEN